MGRKDTDIPGSGQQHNASLGVRFSGTWRVHDKDMPDVGCWTMAACIMATRTGSEIMLESHGDSVLCSVLACYYTSVATSIKCSPASITLRLTSLDPGTLKEKPELPIHLRINDLALHSRLLAQMEEHQRRWVASHVSMPPRGPTQHLNQC